MSQKMTTRIQSVTVVVPDQDEALKFYTEVLGFELRNDSEPMPGHRWLEVAPPGSPISIVLLPPDSAYPLAVRLLTDDADAAYERLRSSPARLHQDAVLRLDFAPPMFSFEDPDGNVLVYGQDTDPIT